MLSFQTFLSSSFTTFLSYIVFYSYFSGKNKNYNIGYFGYQSSIHLTPTNKSY